MPDRDIAEQLQARVADAYQQRTPLRIIGGGSKDFLGRRCAGAALDCAGHAGLVSYDPTELVVTVRAGTGLDYLQSTLASQGQMLPFEPPSFGERATIGGTVACGLSGPRRPFAGAARDFVLGTRLLNGRGEILRFGGQVMKNVAGYDLSRLMCGAFGTLGVLLEVSLKVLPRPPVERTRRFEMSAREAIEAMNRWAGAPFPITGACHVDGSMQLRLSGAETAVAAAEARLGGEAVTDAEAWWVDLREQRLAFFHGENPLWRLSVKSSAPTLDLPGRWLVDWGGAQRWLRSEADAQQVRQVATAAGGHATLFRGGDRHGEVFSPLTPALAKLHRAVKRALDPAAILNPGRLYADL